MSTFFGHRCVNLLCEVQFSTFNKCVLHAGGSLSEYVVYDGSGLCKRRTIWLDRQKQRFLVPMQVNYFIYLFVLILHADLLILPFLKHSFASRFRRRWTQTFSKLCIVKVAVTVCILREIISERFRSGTQKLAVQFSHHIMSEISDLIALRPNEDLRSNPRAALWRWRNNGGTCTLLETAFSSCFLQKVSWVQIISICLYVLLKGTCSLTSRELFNTGE